MRGQEALTAEATPRHRVPVDRERLVRSCEPCEVTWRGRPDSVCWSCGGHGVQVGRVALMD